MEPFQRVYKDVPQLLVMLLRRMKTHAKLHDQTCVERVLEKGVCNDPGDHYSKSQSSLKQK